MRLASPSDHEEVSDDEVSEHSNPDKGRRLYVGNLPFDVTWYQLKDLMKAAGQVDRVNIAARNNGSSRGFGTVLFGTEEGAQKAIEMYNDFELQGRIIEVREDRRKPEPKPKPEPEPEHNHQQSECRAVWIGNLPFISSWQDLKDLIRPLGLVPVRTDIAVDHNGRSRGHGIALLKSVEEAKKVIEALHDTEFEGRKLLVKFDKGFSRNRGYPPFNHGASRRGPDYRRGNENFKPSNTSGSQLYVGNLPFAVRWQELKELFREAGGLIRADVASAGGRSKGFGTVVFATREDAVRAIQKFNGYSWDGRPILVREDKFASSR